MLGQEVGEGLTEELRPQCESRQINRSLSGGESLQGRRNSLCRDEEA